MQLRTTYRRVLATTLLAAVTTACLSSAGLASWADALPESTLAEWASTAAHVLDATMTARGVNRPTAAIQSATRALEARKFSPAP